jgi:5-(carboxyamino)imidazole ribonucleotide mutase
MQNPQVGIIMGSTSDLKVMREAADILDEFGIPFELTIVSAHRTLSVSWIMQARQPHVASR